MYLYGIVWSVSYDVLNLKWSLRYTQQHLAVSLIAETAYSLRHSHDNGLVYGSFSPFSFRLVSGRFIFENSRNVFIIINAKRYDRVDWLSPHLATICSRNINFKLSWWCENSQIRCHCGYLIWDSPRHYIGFSASRFKKRTLMCKVDTKADDVGISFSLLSPIKKIIGKETEWNFIVTKPSLNINRVINTRTLHLFINWDVCRLELMPKCRETSYHLFSTCVCVASEPIKV